MTSRQALFEERARVRDKGFATAYEELETGLNAAAVPVRDHTGAVVAALSSSGPAYRLDKAAIEARIEDLKGAAAQISGRMGYLDQRAVGH